MIFIGQLYHIRNSDWLNFQEIKKHSSKKWEYLEQQSSAAITAVTRLGIESYREWMAFTGIAPHEASLRCHNSSRAVTDV